MTEDDQSNDNYDDNDNYNNRNLNYCDNGGKGVNETAINELFWQNELQIELKHPSPWVFYSAILLDENKKSDVKEIKKGQSINSSFYNLLECFKYWMWLAKIGCWETENSDQTIISYLNRSPFRSPFKSLWHYITNQSSAKFSYENDRLGEKTAMVNDEKMLTIYGCFA